MGSREEITWSPWYQVTSLPQLGDYIQAKMATKNYTRYHDHEALVTYVNGTEVTMAPPEPSGIQWGVIKWRKRLIGQIDEIEEEKKLELT